MPARLTTLKPADFQHSLKVNPENWLLRYISTVRATVRPPRPRIERLLPLSLTVLRSYAYPPNVCAYARAHGKGVKYRKTVRDIKLISYFIYLTSYASSYALTLRVNSRGQLGFKTVRAIKYGGFIHV